MAKKQRYSARPYAPMPTVRWGVWREGARDFTLIALIPEGRYARGTAKKIATALNSTPNT